MRKQTDMVASFQQNHQEFFNNLTSSLESLERDIREAQEIDAICTDEWCVAIERDIDDLHNVVYSISEPRFTDRNHSEKIRTLRSRLHDVYERYKGVRKQVVH